MIEIKNLSKTFSTADGTFHALKNVNISVSDGDIFGIIGMSGAGKSTLVRCINMLERPSDGNVVIDGVDVGALGRRELRKLRRSVTMIFQGFNLLMQRTCLKNVCFPLELDGVGKKEAKKRALELLELVGLSDKANAYPSRLSGGQQQRVAIARAGDKPEGAALRRGDLCPRPENNAFHSLFNQGYQRKARYYGHHHYSSNERD